MINKKYPEQYGLSRISENQRLIVNQLFTGDYR